MLEPDKNLRTLIKQKIERVDKKKKADFLIENSFPDLVPEGIDLEKLVNKNRKEIENDFINKWNI